MTKAVDTNAECDDMHNRWYDRDIVPRVRLLVLTILASGVSLAGVVLFFIINSAVRDHELKDRDATVSRREFEQTISRIETRVEKMESSVNSSLAVVLEKLDENHQAIVRSSARNAR